MDYLDELENESLYIIREAYSKIKNIAMLWSIGKDSTTLLWLIRKAFWGEIPFPIIHIDTSYKFNEIYEFRDFYAKKWNLNLIVYKNVNAIQQGISPEHGRFECCTELKTNALRAVVEEMRIRGLFLGIRRDEHGIRAKERVFSLRDSDFEWNYKNQVPEFWGQYKTKTLDKEHIRIHPLLEWTELDIWNYVYREKIPIVNLYFAQNEKRFRSIGCQRCCEPISSKANNIESIIEELKTTRQSERFGRAQDKETDYMMQKLRSLGYM